MPPQDGAPADECDVWLRNITNKNHVRPDGRLHNSAFKGKAIARQSGGRPWDHELSGRLLSITKQFEAEGQQYCRARSLLFVGVMYALVRTLRASVNEIKTD